MVTYATLGVACVAPNELIISGFWFRVIWSLQNCAFLLTCMVVVHLLPVPDSWLTIGLQKPEMIIKNDSNGVLINIGCNECGRWGGVCACVAQIYQKKWCIEALKHMTWMDIQQNHSLSSCTGANNNGNICYTGCGMCCPKLIDHLEVLM